MKKLLIYLYISMLANAGYCQAPVMDSTWMPKPGDKYYVYFLYGDTIVNPYDTGSNIIWDFKSVFGKGSSKVDSFDFAIPAIRTITCVNPLANIDDGVPDKFFCLIKNTAGIYRTEEKTQFPAPYGYFHKIYSKPELWIKNDFTFRQSFNDTSIYHYNWNNSTTDSPYRANIITHWKYDGFGILKIAGMEFDTAIRVHKTYIVKDTANNVNWDSTVMSYDEYNWYKPNLHAPMVQVLRSWHISLKHLSTDTLKTDIFARITMPIPTMPEPPVSLTGLDGATATFNGNMMIVNGLPSDFTYALFDATGQLIMQGNPRNNKTSTMRIPAHISPAMYLLKLQDKNGQTKSIKLVKTQ